MIELVCCDDTGCTGITKGLMYKLRPYGNYYLYNGTKYRKDRFKPLHSHIPEEKYYEILGLGSVTVERLNEINNECNRRKGKVYEECEISAIIPKVPVRSTVNEKVLREPFRARVMRYLRSCFNR